MGKVEKCGFCWESIILDICLARKKARMPIPLHKPHDEFFKETVAPGNREALYAQSIFVYLFTNSELKKEEQRRLIQTMPNNLKNIAMNTLEKTGSIKGDE